MVAPNAHEPEAIDHEAIEVEATGARARALFLQACRDDVNEFISYVMVDDESGRPFEQEPWQEEAHRRLTRHRRLVIETFPESGKTAQFGIGRVLWRLGNNPDLRVVLLNNTRSGAKTSLDSIKKYIEKSERLHAVFPDLKPGNIWQDAQITVARKRFSKDPSVRAVGYHGDLIGSRVDMFVIDDLLDFENTRTEIQRGVLQSWFFSTTVIGRLTRSGEAVFLCNTWHPKDLAHELARRGWARMPLPVINDQGRPNSRRWPLERLAAVRGIDYTEAEFSRLFLLKPIDEDTTVFKAAHIQACRDASVGYCLVDRIDEVPPGCAVVAGVDLGGKRRTNGKTAIVVTFFHPDGTRQILWAEEGNWRAREIIRRIVSVSKRFAGCIVGVENNGLQAHLVDLAREERATDGTFEIPTIVHFTTGKNKVDPKYGVASLAAEFESVRWIVPPERRGDQTPSERALELLIQELLDYVPSADKHTGDLAMACWISREIGRKLHLLLNGRPDVRDGGNVGIRVIG